MLRHRAATATATYRAMHIASSPARLLDGLYQKLLTDLSDAQQFINRREIVPKAKAVNHALLIVGELEAALDRESAPQLCRDLSQLYGFVKERLLAASLSMDPEPIDEARRVLETLRESFAAASGVST